MPTFKILTNVPRSQVPADFLAQATEILAKAIGKPAQYICIVVVPDQLMSFGGTSEPCAQIELTSIGKLGVEENKALAAVICKLVQEKLGIPDTRAYVVFTDKPGSEWGYKGTTFDELAKKI